MSTIPTPPAIPQTDALDEASPDSLAELMSRDPEDHRADRDRIIAAMRQHRERLARAAEAAASAPPKKRKSKAAKATPEPVAAPAALPDE